MKQMKEEVDTLRAYNMMYEDELKEAKSKVTQLEHSLKMTRNKMPDPSKFMMWGFGSVLIWIMSLDNGRFKKYEDVLRDALEGSAVMGEDLLSVNELVIKIWGIKDRRDQKALLKHIEKLAQQNANNK